MIGDAKMKWRTVGIAFGLVMIVGVVAADILLLWPP
jgi:hypothetical protein